MVAEAVDIKKEYYLAILHRPRRPAARSSSPRTEGGVDIEDVADDTPEKIFKEFVDPAARPSGLPGAQAGRQARLHRRRRPRPFGKLINALYKLFMECDCSMVEINPLVDDARRPGARARRQVRLRRQRALPPPGHRRRCATSTRKIPREIEASKFDLNYIGLDGNIACLVNGAGLAMATMDIIKHFGGEPANFLDVGGGATKEQVTAAFKIILGDPNVKGILVNIFGGIMDCNVIANGIVAAAKEVGLQLPLVVRLEGNNVDAGKKTLADSGVDLITGRRPRRRRRESGRRYRRLISWNCDDGWRATYDFVLRFSRRYTMGASPDQRRCPELQYAPRTRRGRDGRHRQRRQRTAWIPERTCWWSSSRPKAAGSSGSTKLVDHSFHLADRAPLSAISGKTNPTSCRQSCCSPRATPRPRSGPPAIVQAERVSHAENPSYLCWRLVIQETPTNAVEFSGRSTEGILPAGDHWWSRADQSINDLAA